MKTGWKRACRCLICTVLSMVAAGAGCRRAEREPQDAVSPHPLPAVAEPLFIPMYARYLAGLKICLDPGHGGRADVPNYKRGPTGLQEAEVNLRVALMLRDLLTEAGATVVMTRETDIYLHPDEREDLRLRAELVNRSGCDLFLSIHHNAGSRPDANFSSVWYHKDVDHSPASLDLARHLAASLRDELRLPELLGCDVLSDQLMYKSGFAILRQVEIPAVLSEASFFSNPLEEERLRDPQYNRREAYALFLGLARYAYGGLPRSRILEPADGRIDPTRRRDVVIHLDDGLSARKSWGWERRTIPRDSIIVRVNNEPVPFSFEEADSRVVLHLPDRTTPGPIEVWVQFQNLYRHANLTPRHRLHVQAPPSRAS